MSNIDTNALSEELRSSLKKADKGRKLVTFFKIPMYFLCFIFLIFVITTPFLGQAARDIAQSGVLVKIIIPVFAIIYITQFGFIKSIMYFNKLENDIIAKIIKILFPNAKYKNAQHQTVRLRIIENSKLFPKVGKNKLFPHTQTYVSLTLQTGDTELNVADLAVSFGTTSQVMASNQITSYFFLLYKAILKPMLSSRVDSAIFNFRGMFAWSELKKDIKADVLIFPDHLEDKLGYLAQNIQSMKTVYKNTLVKMEDSEFERLFAVYSDNEITARYILTPLMMRKITELRNKFNRDMMISFTGNCFYIAIETNEGFLALRGKELDNKNIVEEIYSDIKITSEILQELSLYKFRGKK